MTYRARFWSLTAAAAAIRLLIIGRLGLSGDEAHYWAYTQHPALSYFDHPPLIAWAIKLSTIVFGHTAFAVRLPTVLLFCLTGYLVYRLAERLFDERTAFWSAVLLNILPVFSFLGAVITVPDAPLAACWAGFALIFLSIVRSERPSLARWAALGAVLGVAGLAKYTAALLPLSALTYLLMVPGKRRLLATSGPYLALAMAAAVFSPVIIWNLQNGGVSFGFQLAHGLGTHAPRFSFDLLGRALGAQAGYISPVFFVLFWAALIPLARRQPFLFAFSAPTLVLFNAIASFNEILPHWPATGYLLLTVGVVQELRERWALRGVRVTAYAAGATALALTLLVPLQALLKPLDPAWFLPAAEAVKVEDGVTKAEKVDITNELYGWEAAGAKVAEMLSAAPGATVPFVFTHRHYIASQMQFAIPGHPPVYALSERIDAYDLWQRDLRMLDGRDALFVTNDYFALDPATVFPFRSFDPPVKVEVRRNGRLCRLFWITRCHGFSLKDLPAEYTAERLGPELCLRTALVRVDHALFRFFNQSLRCAPLDLVMRWVSRMDVSLGLNTGLLVLMAMVAAVLWRTRREKFWVEFLLALAIVAIGGLLVNFMKDWFGRPRPPAVFGDQVCSFDEIFYKGSFPSGHTQIAFGIATYLTTRLRKYWWAFFAFAVFIGFSRMYIGVHFPSDVLAGAAVGSAVALIMVKLVKL